MNNFHVLKGRRPILELGQMDIIGHPSRRPKIIFKFFTKNLISFH
jgi:hypothetical protein